MESHPHLESPRDQRLKLTAGLAAILVAGTLFVLKIVFAFASGSLGILASALDSSLDVLTSVINYLAMRAASKPADHEHRYGHGKFEALAGFLQSILIFMSGSYLMYQAIARSVRGYELRRVEEGMIIMGISLALTTGLVLFQNQVLKKSSSIALRADRLHYLTDVWTNVLILISLYVERRLQLGWLDPLIGAGMGLYIMKSAWEIFRDSSHILLDRDIAHVYREDIQKFVDKHNPPVVGFHDIRARSAGTQQFLEVHLEVEKEISLLKSHELVEELIAFMRKHHPTLDITVHTDPVHRDPKTGEVELFDRDEPRFY